MELTEKQKQSLLQKSFEKKAPPGRVHVVPKSQIVAERIINDQFDLCSDSSGALWAQDKTTRDYFSVDPKMVFGAFHAELSRRVETDIHDIPEPNSINIAIRRHLFRCREIVRVRCSRSYYDSASHHIYIELGKNRYLIISADGWKVVENCPLDIMFDHKKNYENELPSPSTDCDHAAFVKSLAAILTLGEAETASLLAWAANVMLPHEPCPILSFTGPQGSGKTTRASIMSALLDGQECPQTMAGTSPLDLGVSLSNSQIVILDNIASLAPADLSDVLCVAATRGQISRRKLYTDNLLVSIRLTSGIIMTCISSASARPELRDRLISFRVDRPADFKGMFEIMAPARALTADFWGFISDTIVQYLRRASTIPPQFERMVAFARLGTLIAWDVGINDYAAARRAELLSSAIDDLEFDPVGRAIRRRLCDLAKPDTLFGRIQTIFDELKPYQDRAWPAHINIFARHLCELGPSLNQLHAIFRRERRRDRNFYSISRTPDFLLFFNNNP